MDIGNQIKTKRLVLKRPDIENVSKIVQYAGNKKISDMTLNLPYPYQEEDAVFWINMANQGFKSGEAYIFGITLIEKNEFVGGISLTINKRFNRGEIGYWIAEPFWNKGYATEATKAIIQFGFEDIKLNKILSNHITENPASGKVMIKNGMIKEGELQEHILKDNKYYSLIQYRILKSEYINS